MNDVNDNEPVFNNERKFALIVSPRASVGAALSLAGNHIDAVHVSDADKARVSCYILF